MLGYSSVAHAGTIMVGLVAGTAAGLAAAGFYSLIYVLMNLTCFWVVCRVSTDGRNLKLADLNGLYSREPFLAFVLAVAALSLVGLPPTAGFMGKLFLFSAAWGHGFNWLVVTAVLNTAVSIYYYLNFIRHAYTREAEDSAPAVPRTAAGIVWGGVLSCLLLLLGMIPSPVYHWAEVAGRMLVP
jgi:NADH-quinone oxidoreductase subunit N